MATIETVQNAPPVYDSSSDEKKVALVSCPIVTASLQLTESQPATHSVDSIDDISIERYEQ